MRQRRIHHQRRLFPVARPNGLSVTREDAKNARRHSLWETAGGCRASCAALLLLLSVSCARVQPGSAHAIDVTFYMHGPYPNPHGLMACPPDITVETIPERAEMLVYVDEEYDSPLAGCHATIKDAAAVQEFENAAIAFVREFRSDAPWIPEGARWQHRGLHVFLDTGRGFLHCTCKIPARGKSPAVLANLLAALDKLLAGLATSHGDAP